MKSIAKYGRPKKKAADQFSNMDKSKSEKSV